MNPGHDFEEVGERSRVVIGDVDGGKGGDWNQRKVTGSPDIEDLDGDQLLIAREVNVVTCRDWSQDINVETVRDWNNNKVTEGIESGNVRDDELSLPLKKRLNWTQLAVLAETVSLRGDSAIIQELSGSPTAAEHFKCGSCREVFRDALSLDQHNLTKHQRRTLKCNFCRKGFFLGELQSLQQHILEKHYQGPKCGICSVTFASKDALKNHVRQVHLNETFTCEVCNMECQDLYFHMENFHKDIVSTSTTPSQSLKGGAGVRRTCPDCLKEVSADNYLRHQKEQHAKVKKACPFCLKEFGPSNLGRHIKCVSVFDFCFVNTKIFFQASPPWREKGLPHVPKDVEFGKPEQAHQGGAYERQDCLRDLRS